jgi:hypothetical protein
MDQVQKVCDSNILTWVPYIYIILYVLNIATHKRTGYINIYLFNNLAIYLNHSYQLLINN